MIYLFNYSLPLTLFPLILIFYPICLLFVVVFTRQPEISNIKPYSLNASHCNLSTIFTIFLIFKYTQTHTYIHRYTHIPIDT